MAGCRRLQSSILGGTVHSAAADADRPRHEAGVRRREPSWTQEAEYAPWGSEQAVANIRRAIRPGKPGRPARQPHGVLVFHRTSELAVLVGGVVEEAAQASITARQVGAATVIPDDLRAAALQRAMDFEATGTRSVGRERDRAYSLDPPGDGPPMPGWYPVADRPPSAGVRRG